MQYAVVLFVLGVLAGSSQANLWDRFKNGLDAPLKFKPQESQVSQMLNKLVRHNRKQTANWAPPAFCHGLDCPQYTVLKKYTDYEVRQYNGGWYVGATVTGARFMLAETELTMRLLKYLYGFNAAHTKLPIKVPAVTRVIPEGDAWAANYTSWVYYAHPMTPQPPKPTDKAMFLTRDPPLRMYVRTFTGVITESDWLTQAKALKDSLNRDKVTSYEPSFYYLSIYDSPMAVTRHNEVWFQGK